MGYIPNDAQFHQIGESGYVVVSALMNYTGPGALDQPTVVSYAIGTKRGMQVQITWSKNNSSAVDDYITLVQTRVVPKTGQTRCKVKFSSNLVVAVNSIYSQDGFDHSLVCSSDAMNPSVNNGGLLSFPLFRAMYSSLGAAGAAVLGGQPECEVIIDGGGVMQIDSHFYCNGTTANISTGARVGWMLSLEYDTELPRQPKIN